MRPLTIIVLASLVSTGGFGSVWYVDKDTPALPGDQDGVAWDTAFDTIQEGVDAAFAAHGGDVWVAEGVYAEDRPNRTGSLVMRAGARLYGGFVGAAVGGYEDDLSQRDWVAHVTTIDGSTARSGGVAYHVAIGASNATLDGFTIAAGNANGGGVDDFGGGLYNYLNSAPTVANCTFTGNRANWGGGGMYNFKSSPLVTGCTFSANTAFGGGGIENDTDGTPSLEGCSFLGNTAFVGGAALVTGSWATVTNCVFMGNSAVVDGGAAVVVQSSEATFTGCTFMENTASGKGGGVGATTDSTCTLTTCVFEGNSATQSGGGLSGDASTFVVEGCSFTANTAQVNGGAVSSVGSSFTAAACSFAGNSTQADGGAVHFDDCSPATLDGCTLTGNSAVGNGGAIHNLATRVVVTNCMIAGNQTDGKGGGLYSEDSLAPLVSNCTFVGNSAGVQGGAVHVEGTSLTAVNSIFWSDAPNEITKAASAVLTITYCDVQAAPLPPGAGNFNKDPLFVDMENDDFTLHPWSPCVDTGRNTSGASYGSVTEDFELDARGFDGDGLGAGSTGDGSDYDIGADELNPATRDADGDGMPDGWELNHSFDPTDPDDADEDADGDGLSNRREFLHRTDPHDRDTDGGGIWDGEEVAYGRAPLNPLDDRREDINVDCNVDALDIQLAINAALGLDISPWDADCNRDGSVDALDVQRVINAALGIS